MLPSDQLLFQTVLLIVQDVPTASEELQLQCLEVHLPVSLLYLWEKIIFYSSGLGGAPDRKGSKNNLVIISNISP